MLAHLCQLFKIHELNTPHTSSVELTTRLPQTRLLVDGNITPAAMPHIQFLERYKLSHYGNSDSICVALLTCHTGHAVAFRWILVQKRGMAGYLRLPARSTHVLVMYHI